MADIHSYLPAVTLVGLKHREIVSVKMNDFIGCETTEFWKEVLEEKKEACPV